MALPRHRFAQRRTYQGPDKGSQRSAVQSGHREEASVLGKFTAGSGRVEATPNGWRLLVSASSGYSDAQLDDTQGRARRALPHRPPLKLLVEARASASSPPGTLGFGFWNDPFPAFAGETGARRLLPAMPQALWYFYSSPPSELPFAAGGAGTGWRAASLRSPVWPGAAVAALGAAAFAAMLFRPLRRTLIPLGWRAVEGAQSAPIAGLDSWRRYEIDWSVERARFSVDDRTVLEAVDPPTEALGLVIWIDNQWAALSVGAGLRFGIVPHAPGASLEIRQLSLNGNPIEVADSKGRGALP